MYDDRKGKTKASNVTCGSVGTLDFGAPTSRHHLGKYSIDCMCRETRHSLLS